MVGHGFCVKDAHSNGYFYTLILLQLRQTTGKTSLDVTRLPTIKLNLYWLKEMIKTKIDDPHCKKIPKPELGGNCIVVPRNQLLHTVILSFSRYLFIKHFGYERF